MISKKMLVIFSVFLISLFLFSGCVEEAEEPAGAAPAPPAPGVEELSFSEGLDLLNTAFSDNGIYIDVALEIEDLAAIEESSLNAIDSKLKELKASFKNETLKDLAGVYLVLLEQYSIRKVSAEQISVTMAIEEKPLAERCLQLAEFDVLVQKTQAVVDSYNKLNQKINSFTSKFPSEAEEAGLDIFTVDSTESFTDFSETKTLVDDLKALCEEETGEAAGETAGEGAGETGTA